MRVLFVTPLTLDAATARYRCGHLAEALRLAGHHADIVQANSPSVAVCHDIVVLHRLFWNRAGRRFHAAARAAGAVVVYGADDLIFDIEFAFHIGFLHPNDALRWRYYRGEVEANRDMLRRADAVLVSTTFLADQTRAFLASEAGKGEMPPVLIAPNFPGEAIWKASTAAQAAARRLRDIRRDDRVTLGYLSGSPTHEGDLADIALSLATVLRNHSHVRLLVAGSVKIPPVLQTFVDDGRIRFHPTVPWRDLPALLAPIDINLAPLDPTRAFGHAKSHVKWLEAAAVGVPTIAGAAAGFVEGVRDGEDCLVAHTGAEWETHLTRLVFDPALRDRIGSAAHDNAAANATPVSQAAAVSELFERMLSLRPATHNAPSASPIMVRRPLQEQIFARLKAGEASLYRAVHRQRRHDRLLRDEVAQ